MACAWFAVFPFVALIVALLIYSWRKAEQRKKELAAWAAQRGLRYSDQMSYDLKANQNFLHLQEELVHTEDRIQRARRFYNANVRDLSNRLQMFPSNVLARMFRFQPREYFEIESAVVRDVPEVRL